MEVVDWWILEQDDAGRKLDAAEDDIHRRAAAGPIGLPIMKFGCDVLVAAQRVEAVLVVMVQRGFVAQPLPDRVRVVVDREIVRVVIHIDRAGARHCATSDITTSPTRFRYGQASSGGT